MSSLMVDFITSLDSYGGTTGGWPGFWGMEGPEFSPGSRKTKRVSTQL